jgi:hypothetical protein
MRKITWGIWILLAGAAVIGSASIAFDVGFRPQEVGTSFAELTRLFAGLLLTLFAGAWLWELQESEKRGKVVALLRQELASHLTEMQNKTPKRIGREGSEITGQMFHLKEVTISGAVNSGLLPLSVTSILTELLGLMTLYDRIAANVLLSLNLLERPRLQQWTFEWQKLEGLQLEIESLLRRAQAALDSEYP